MTTRRRLLPILCAVGMAVTLMANPASAATILVFGQSGAGNLFTGNETAGTTVLDANNIPVTITTLNEAPAVISAFFNLDATSTAAAQQVPMTSAWTQPYDGDFQITSGLGGTGINYLSGIFSGIQLGVVGGTQLVLASSQPPLSLTFTSSVIPPAFLLEPRAMGITLTNVTPPVSIVNNSFADFNATVAGNFSAEVIPEPASILLLGSGLVGLASASRRRKKSARKQEQA
jgi:PEP-CTERM motif